LTINRTERINDSNTQEIQRIIMGRPVGSGNKFKKPDFVRMYERFRRRYKTDPVEMLFQFSTGKVDGETIPMELRYRATKDLVITRYAPATVAKYDEAIMQQDMFETAAGDKLVFGVQSAA
jgi:hypothetical protein